MLHHIVEGGGQRVVLVHGFTQTLRSWDEVAGRLVVDGFEVVRVDAPGHGGSADVHLDLPGCAAALAEFGPASFVGYSMGGRAVLRLALDHPESVRALVLIGVSPGIADDRERRARRRADRQQAAAIERDGVEAFLQEWLAQPLFATLPPGAAGLADRLTNTPDGLAASLRRIGTGAMEPLWDRLPEIDHPTLLLAGEHDHKFGDIARRMQAAIGPKARALLTPGAGHAAHLEQPVFVADEMARFIRATTPG